MKNKRSKYISRLKNFICLSMLFQGMIISGAWCQDNMSTVETAFTQYHHTVIKEKIFVHTDKRFYIAGEIMWFKLYNVDASLHTPLALSKLAYIEIIDSLNKTVLQAKISLSNGEGDGSFYLPLTLNSGNYKLRAYTNWMKNFDPEYFFNKDVAIVNVQKSLSSSSIKPDNKFDIQFFPEGGNLVNNIASKVAFKGTDVYGRGINFKGFLVDNTDTILTFTSQHAGMGFFSFTPLSQHIYKALVKTDSGTEIIKPLPAAYNSGLVMSLLDSANKIKITVTADATARQTVYLFVHTRGIIKVTQSAVIQNGKAVFIFDKSLTGDGVSQITIFNEQKQPMCERLFFKKPQHSTDIKLSTDQATYATRRKVNLQIQSAGGEKSTDTASLSISVFRVDSLQSLTASTVSSYMLLTSDVNGYIEDPGYYFSNDVDKTNIELDNLLLTNGWRRFRWEDILKNAKPYFTYAPEYHGALVNATVINKNTGKPTPGVEMYVSVPGFQKAFNASISDSSGQVTYELPDLPGASELMFQPKNLKDSFYKVELENPFSSNFASGAFPPFQLPSFARIALRDQSVSMQVQNIYTAKSLKHFTEPIIDSSTFYSVPDAKYLLDNYTRFATIEEILREYVILVDVKKRESIFHYDVFDLSNNAPFKTDPLVLLDGVPVADLNKFMQVDPIKLYKLEVVNHRYFFGQSVFYGILNWTSYKKDLADFEPGERATVIDYNGVQKERQFYAPVYENQEAITDHLPDFRNVLLWRPYIKIANATSKDISFYTSDLPGKYAIHLQGISKNGECISRIAYFEVKR